MYRNQIVYVDKNPLRQDAFSSLLGSHFQVHIFSSLKDFSAQLHSLDVGALIFEGSLFDESYLDTQEVLRNQFVNYDAPVIFRMMQFDDRFKERVLALGASDILELHMTKSEIISRLQTRIHEFKRHLSVVKLGNLVLNRRNLECFIESHELQLTMIEFKILLHLLQLFPRSITKNELIERIWKSETHNQNNINTHLFNLRSKIQKWDYEIVNHRTQGFSIEQKDELFRSIS